MARKILSPYDPATALLESIATLIRDGVPFCSVIPQPVQDWQEGKPCPAGHYLCPEGTQLLIDRDFGTVTETPALILNAPDDAREKSDEVLGAYLIGIEIRVIVPRDFDMKELDSIIDALCWILTQPVVLDDASRQQPQERLSRGNLVLFGNRWEDNFAELGTSKITEENEHPMRLLGFKCCCGIMMDPL